jgi:folate-binding protein YgfZ
MTLAREGEFHSNVVILTPLSSSIPIYEIWCLDRKIIKELYRHFEFYEATPVSPEALEAFRILSAIPKFGVDITEKYLSQETAQTHALHFSKGCYLGQEIVERIQSRGQVHRTFTQFTLSGEMPTLPAPLEVAALSPDSKAKPAGELTSAALIDGTIYALGYTRRELLDTHQPLTYAGGIATASTAPKLTPKT